MKKPEIKMVEPKTQREQFAEKLGCLVFALFIIVVFSMFLLSYKVESEQIGYDRAKTELIQDAQASEAVPVQPVQVVESSTSQEEWARIETVLQRYQSPINTIHLAWTEEHYNCDPSLLVAIMVADTSLGTKGHGAETFNPGNVANTEHSFSDGYPGWQEGVNAVCTTLNNQYLGGHNQLGELSCGGQNILYGGCVKSYYASSSNNWHINVFAIMSELKGYPVGATYQFRRT